MRYIEDEKAYYTNVNSAVYSQNNLQVVPMYYIDVPEGEWSVDISTEGYQASSSTSDPNRGKSDGFIAYSNDSDGIWNVGQAENIEISKLWNENTYREAHPDLEVNGCHFRDHQLIERDATISFHASAKSNARFFLIGPPIQKQEKYNYTISYGEWTDRSLELGLISVVLDEHLESSMRSVNKRPVKEGHLRADMVYTPAPLTPESKPVKQTPNLFVALREPPPPEGKPEQTNPKNMVVVNDPEFGPIYVDPEYAEALQEEIPDYAGPEWHVPKRGEPLADITDRPPRPPRSQDPAKLRGNTGNYERDYADKENWDPTSWPPKDQVPIPRNQAELRELNEQIQSKRDNRFSKPPLAKRLFGTSSIGTGSLVGGSLNNPLSAKLQGLTTEQRVEYDRLRRTQGRSVANDYLNSLFSHSP
uniref:Orf5 n=1 Tax=Ullucus polerovirus 1 TaxID=2491943 RepID=A0A3G8FWM1_9VIRU|nr:orf5 [Ullucus polerovirus 1]